MPDTSISPPERAEFPQNEARTCPRRRPAHPRALANARLYSIRHAMALIEVHGCKACRKGQRGKGRGNGKGGHAWGCRAPSLAPSVCRAPLRGRNETRVPLALSELSIDRGPLTRGHGFGSPKKPPIPAGPRGGSRCIYRSSQALSDPVNPKMIDLLSCLIPNSSYQLP